MSSRETPSPLESSRTRHHAWWGAAFELAVAIGALLALAAVWFEWIEPREAEFERWLGSLGAWSPVFFIASVVVATSLFLPKSLFSMAAGAIFGLGWGLLWMLSASVLAAVLTFALVRWRLRGATARLLARHPRLSAIDAAVAERGTRLVLLLRMTPIGFAAMNLTLSASRIGFRSYLLGLLGLVPGTLSAVSIGFAARHTADLAARSDGAGGGVPHGDSILREVVLYASVAACVTVAIVVGRIAISSIRRNPDPASSSRDPTCVPAESVPSRGLRPDAVSPTGSDRPDIGPRTRGH